MVRAPRTRSAGRIAAAVLAIITVCAVAGAIGAVNAAAPGSVSLAAPTALSPADLTGTTSSPTSQSITGSLSTESTAGSVSTSSSSQTAASSSATVASSVPESPTTAATNSTSAAESSTTAGTAESSLVAVPTSVGSTVVPATPPAAAQSGIGRGTLLIAVGVLLIALTVVGLVVAGTRRGQGSREVVPNTGKSPSEQRLPIPTSEPLAGQPGLLAHWSSDVDGSSPRELMAFLVQLGDAMVDSGDPVTHVSGSLRQVAKVNGLHSAEIIVLPTALIITLPEMQESRTEVASTGGASLRLDQVEAVFTIADAAERGDIGPREALVELAVARALPPSFGPAVIVAGHAVIAVGLAVILTGGWTEMAIAAVLGGAVGLIKQWSARRRLAIQVFLPVSCALLVAAAVALLARTELEPAVLPPILGALVTFIPGGLLTTAVIELATGQMISGASRFVYGSLQLVLLSLGILGGLQLVGIPAITVTESDASVIGAVAPWLGVLVFGVGVLLSYSGRPDSLGWMLLVLYVAYAAQVVGGLLFGNSLSAFVGAAVMTPVAVFVATQRSGPPTLVTFLPAFWLLVPGAIALVGVTQVMGQARLDGVSSILGAGVTIISIALGVVLGLSVGDGVKRLVR